DIYAAKSEILLKSAETYDYQAQIYSNLGYYGLIQDVTNQKRILASYDMISNTLKKLDFDISYYLVGRWATDPVHTFHFIDIDVVHVEPQLYNIPITVRVQDYDTFEMSYELYGKVQKKTLPFGELVEDVHYRLIVSKSERFNLENFEQQKDRVWQFVVRPHGYLVSKYRGSLSIDNIDYTSILTLQVRDEVPERAKIFLDSLSRVYIDYTLESQFTVNQNTERHIEAQLTELQGIIDSLEYEMERFKASNNILDIDKESDEYFQSLVEFDSERRQLELRYESIESLEEFLFSEEGDAALPPSFYVFEEDQMLRNQVEELFNLKVDRTQKLIDFKPTHLEIYRIDSLISTVRVGILRYTLDTKQAVKKKIEDVGDQIRRLESVLKGIPKSQRDILGIDRKLKVNESLYIFLLEKKANTVIARAAIIPQTNIIEEARSLGVVGPNKDQTIYTAIGGGLAIALLIGFVRLIFFERIENVREMKKLSKIPVLGGVPNYTDLQEDPIVITAHPRSNVSEALRTIRTNLQYMLPGDDPKVILVTSLHPGEGKTFASSNIASVFAKANKKVLILDFDLHKPKIHKTFGLENVSGVSTFLIGKSDFEHSIVPTQVDNLDVITAGPVPP
ncbi:MAG: P-loop NTPase, partial [Flavobacteriales bacterium]|nr:P-loop NTPase [Flavobacteriales bacterium]